MLGKTSMSGILKWGVVVLVVWSLGCGPSYVRDTDVEGLDEDAMSTGLDRSDLDRLFGENLESLFGSEAVDQNDTTTAVGHFTRAVELYDTIPGVQTDPHVLRVKERLKELTNFSCETP